MSLHLGATESTILQVKNNIYYLKELNNFILPINITVNSISHYVAYCCRELGNSWMSNLTFN